MTAGPSQCGAAVSSGFSAREDSGAVLSQSPGCLSGSERRSGGHGESPVTKGNEMYIAYLCQRCLTLSDLGRNILASDCSPRTEFIRKSGTFCTVI